MSENDINQWAGRAAHAAAGTGENVAEIKGQPQPMAGHGEFNYQTGKVQQQMGRTPTEGFKVTGIQPPAAPQPAPQPPDPKAAKEAMMQQHQQRVEQQAEERQHQTEDHARFQENKTVLSELEKQQKELADKDQTDPNVVKDMQAVQQQVMAVRQRMQGAVTPQQGQPQLPTPPQQGHPLDAGTAQHFMLAAGGDKNKARALAKQAGWSF
jgi:hypothetical protein